LNSDEIKVKADDILRSFKNKAESKEYLPPGQGYTFFYPVKFLRGSIERYIITLKLIPFYSKKAAVLDIGSYPGHISRIVKELFDYEVHGLDFSHQVGAQAFASYVDAMKLDGILIRDCNVDRDAIPFSNETFDIVLFTEVIEHLQKPRRILSEINRVLKSNGKLVLSTPNLNSVTNRFRVVVKKPKRFHGVKGYTSKELKTLLEDTNFIIDRLMFVDLSNVTSLKRALVSPQRLSVSFIFFSMIKYALVKIVPSLSSLIFIVASKNRRSFQ